MDLASLFSGMTDALARHEGGEFPAFPTPKGACGKEQTIVNNSISRSSRISHQKQVPHPEPSEEATQAGASGRAGGRARVPSANVREMREIVETPAGTKTCISHTPSMKWEMWEKKGGLPEPTDPPCAAFDERAAFLEYECGLPREEAEAQARAELDPPSNRGLPQDNLQGWYSALARLSPEVSPCPGYRGNEWPRTLSRALAFLDAFGAQAEALGWTAERLFGVHPAAGIVRVDACGALVLPAGGAVRAITATEVAFGHLTHREIPGAPPGVAIWDFCR